MTGRVRTREKRLFGWMITAATALGPVGPARADFVHPSPGVTWITIDTETGLWWLDLTESVGVSFADVEAGAGGFLADGWRHATIDEVCNLLEGHLPPTSPPPRSCPRTETDFPTIVTAAFMWAFQYWLGYTGFSYPSSGSGTAGRAGTSTQSYFVYVGSSAAGPIYVANAANATQLTVASSTIGHYLVKDGPAIPLLSGLGAPLLSALLVTTGAIVIRGRARTRNEHGRAVHRRTARP